MKIIKKILKIIAIIFAICVFFIFIGAIFSVFSENEHKYENIKQMYPIVNLNIRSGHSTDYQIVKTLKVNERTPTYDTIVDGFIMVLDIDSTKLGWSSSKYLQKTPLSKKQLDDIKFKNDPLHIGIDSLNILNGHKIPDYVWTRWGNANTLEGTNNTYWVAYFPKSNVSLVSIKKSDNIIFIDFGKNKAIDYIKNKNKKRTELIERQFSYKGEHINVRNLIKENMNDADSYEHVKTVYYDKTNYIIVKTTFRGNNVFGNKVIETYIAKVSLNGTILEIYKN